MADNEETCHQVQPKLLRIPGSRDKWVKYRANRFRPHSRAIILNAQANNGKAILPLFLGGGQLNFPAVWQAGVLILKKKFEKPGHLHAVHMQPGQASRDVILDRDGFFRGLGADARHDLVDERL